MAHRVRRHARSLRRRPATLACVRVQVQPPKAYTGSAEAPLRARHSGIASRVGSVRDLLGRLFAPPIAPVGPRDAITWWEKRRLVFNVIVLSAAIISLGVYFVLLSATSSIAPGQDSVEPVGLMGDAVVFPIAVNVLYTLGWVIEASVRFGAKKRLLQLGPVLLGIGIAASLVIVLTPTLVWVAVLVKGPMSTWT